MGESFKSKVFVQVENAITYIWPFSIASYTEILSKAFQILLEQHNDQSFLLLTVPRQTGTHTFRHGNICVFLSSLSTVTNPTSDSGLVSKGAQCCSLEMRAEDTSQNLSFHLSNSSLYHEQPRADHIVQGTKKE